MSGRRVVLGFGSDSNDRVVGTVDLEAARARLSDPLPVRLAAAAGQLGWLTVRDPVYSNADQVGPIAGEAIEVRFSAVVWCVLWDSFAKEHGLRDEASRS